MRNKSGHTPLKPGAGNTDAPNGGPLCGIRVLIVEDEMIVAMDVQLSLERDGAIIVGPAVTLKHGLELLASVEFDCAVLDSNLGGDRVFPIADLLYARHVPFVFHTGYLEQTYVDEHWPGARIVGKPSQQRDITAALVSALH